MILIPFLLLLSTISPLLLAEPMLYMFPTNPDLHPPAMYPNQQFMRGKVRDLPDSGVIYLNRIKPIGGEVRKDPDVELSVESIPRRAAVGSKSPGSSFERYSSEEERSPVRLSTTMSPTTTSSSTMRAKSNPVKQAFKKTKPARLTVPEEAELDLLLEDLMKSDGNEQKMKLSKLPKIARSAGKRHVGGVAPKLISFDGTARVETPRVKAYGSPISVKLQPRKLYGASVNPQRTGADFDPWERMGQ